MPSYRIDPGRDEDFILVGGEPVGVITRGAHGKVHTCTMAGRRTHGANGECWIGERPELAVKHARRTGLTGSPAVKRRRRRRR